MGFLEGFKTSGFVSHCSCLTIECQNTGLDFRLRAAGYSSEIRVSIGHLPNLVARRAEVTFAGNSCTIRPNFVTQDNTHPVGSSRSKLKMMTATRGLATNHHGGISPAAMVSEELICHWTIRA